MMTVPEKYRKYEEFYDTTFFSSLDYYYEAINQPRDLVEDELGELFANNPDWLNDILGTINAACTKAKKKHTLTNNIDVFIDSDRDNPSHWNVSVTVHAYREMSEKQKQGVDHRLQVKAAKDRKRAEKEAEKERKRQELQEAHERKMLAKLKEKYPDED